jgi:PncC family amidohydrolase
MSISADLVASLDAARLGIATAESLTGGLVCAALTDVPGASAVVRGSVVAYATEVKAQLLGVDAELLATGGAVQAEVASQMATGVCRLRTSVSPRLAWPGLNRRTGVSSGPCSSRWPFATGWWSGSWRCPATARPFDGTL